MAFPVIAPRESEEMELCRIVRWHVKRGDRVSQGDILCEVDTGKAAFDLEAPADGTVLVIFYRENEEAPLLTPLAVIGEQGESYEQFVPGKQAVKKETHTLPQSGPVEQRVREQAEVMPGVVTSEGSKLASPRARRLALRNGIPLSRVRGSGPDGAVVEKDVRAWLRNLHAS